jgi:hypothetical protein
MVTGREDGEIVVFDADIFVDPNGEPPRMQIKREILEEVARDLGMVSAAEFAEIRRQVAEWGQKLDETLDSLSLAADIEEQINRLKEPA